MTLASYGKRRRGTAGVAGRSRRVPEKPYWEEIKEDEDQNETVGGKSDSAPSTPTRKSPKKRVQILETKSPSASTLSRRSRRRKRPRNETEEGTESLTERLTNLSDVSISFDSSSSPSKPQSPGKDGKLESMEVPKLKLARLDSKARKGDQKKEVQPQEIQNDPPPPPPEPDKQLLEEESSSQDREMHISQSSQEEFREVLGQLPRLESMLSGIHAALMLQAGTSQPLDQTSKSSPTTHTKATLEMHRDMEARQEESIRRLEALCEKQSKSFDELVKQTEIMQSNHEKERDALTKEVETLRTVAKAFEKQQTSNNVVLKKMEKLEASLSNKQEEQENLSNQLLELASNSKKQDIFLLERNVKIQELMEASNTSKSKYEGKIKELTTALRKSESKVQELEAENQQFKTILDSFQASLTASTTSEQTESSPSSQAVHKTPKSKNKPKSPSSVETVHKTVYKTPPKDQTAKHKNQPKSPSTVPKSTDVSASVTKRQTRSAKKASSTVLSLSLEHANIIELPASPFDSMGRFKGTTTSSSSVSKPRFSPSRSSKSSPARSSRPKKLTSSSSNSIGSSSTGRRRRYTKVPVPTFDSLSGINPGEAVTNP